MLFRSEYFYNNTIEDNFYNNTVGNYFQLNDVKINQLNTVDFTEYYGNINGFTYTALGNTASDSVYTNIQGTTNGDGINASFNIEVSSGVVIGVSGNTQGKLYGISDQITILGSQIGGTDVTDDVVITVTGVIQTPIVYTTTSSTIFLNSNGTPRLSYYDGNDILTIIDINN